MLYLPLHAEWFDMIEHPIAMETDMAENKYETHDYISFDSIDGNRVIALDIPNDNFDIENMTVWLTAEDMKELCNADVNILTGSRLVSGGTFSKSKVVRYGNHGETLYALSLAMLMMIDYAPSVTERFASFAVRKLCELYHRKMNSKDMLLRELPDHIENMTKSYDACTHSVMELRGIVSGLVKDVEKLKSEKAAACDISESHPNDMRNVSEDGISDDRFMTVPDFLHLPTMRRLFYTEAFSSSSRMFVMLKSAITAQVHLDLQDRISRQLNISPYEARSMFMTILGALKSPNPPSLASIVGDNRGLELSKLFHYEQTYSFFKDGKLLWNCLLSYPYSHIRSAMCKAIQLNKLEPVIETMRENGIFDSRQISLIKSYGKMTD